MKYIKTFQDFINETKLNKSHDDFLNEENINTLRVKLNQLYKRKEEEKTKKYDSEIDSLVKKINSMKGSVKEDSAPVSKGNMDNVYK